MSFFLSHQVPVLDNDNNDSVAIMTLFEPISFNDKETAEKYAKIFGVLKNSVYDVVDSDSMELYYSNLLDYDVSCCNTK